ncbi:MAG: hypothetical protein AB7G28_18845 [Pirellulales bacterium]
MTDDAANVELPVSKRSWWFRFRVAVSVFFGLLTVALCVIWVKSHRWPDIGKSRFTNFSIGIDVVCGHVRLETKYQPDRPMTSTPQLWIRSPHDFGEWKWSLEQKLPTFDWYCGKDDNQRTLCTLWVPMWLLVAASALLSAVAWLVPLQRFSLRTLLIATTLIAVLLGLAVWAGR